MSAPVILSTSPVSGDTDVVLGTPIRIVFDQALDPATVGEGTFSLMGPGQTAILSPDQLLKNDPTSSTGREYITGKFVFPSPNILEFDPDKPLRPTVTYTVLVVGSKSVIVKDSIKNPAGQALVKSLQFTFTTGDLALNVAPPVSPLPFNDPQVQPWMKPRLNPKDIVIHPVTSAGNDLSQVIELVFPAPLDPATFSLEDIDVSVEPLMDDPLVTVPSGLTKTVRISGNKILITISGWQI